MHCTAPHTYTCILVHVWYTYVFFLARRLWRSFSLQRDITKKTPELAITSFASCCRKICSSMSGVIWDVMYLSNLHFKLLDQCSNATSTNAANGCGLQLNRLVSSAPSMLLEVMMLMFRVWYSDAAASEVAHDSFAFPEALYFRQLVPGMDNNQQRMQRMCAMCVSACSHARMCMPAGAHGGGGLARSLRALTQRGPLTWGNKKGQLTIDLRK